MLTRELAIAEYESGQVRPDRLTRVRHARYRKLAESMLSVYREGAGRMRQQLHRSIHAIFEDEPDCPARRIDAFCKLLDEKATWDKDKRGRAAALRHKVFRMAAARHPLVRIPDQLFESQERKVKLAIASELGIPWREIERNLFSDVIPFHRLREFEGYATPEELLARYNVAQTQAVLYDAVSMIVWATGDFKSILRYAKLARLMHSIVRLGDGNYQITLDGPVSVLRQSRRYGVAFAKFLPALLSCTGWKMKAVIQHRRSGWQNQFRLSPADGLRSHVQPDAVFDSLLEENFAKQWGHAPRDGWRLVREGDVLFEHQKVFVPDFSFVHESGLRVMMEIVGFWTPEYLLEKRKTLAAFQQHRIMLAIAETIHWPEQDMPANESAPDSPPIIRYKSAIRVTSVLQALSELVN
jgi:predicted nuclease of restriction endonuclease-like RecB superfamily